MYIRSTNWRWNVRQTRAPHYFESERARDPDTVNEVIRLLELNESAGDFLEASPAQRLGFLGAAPPTFVIGEQVGDRFQVEEHLGTGGMGTFSGRVTANSAWTSPSRLYSSIVWLIRPRRNVCAAKPWWRAASLIGTSAGSTMSSATD